MRGLAGRTALFTGGGSGPGAASAARLATEGAAVARVNLRADAAETVTADITARRGRWSSAAMSSREDEVARAAERYASELRGPNLLVNFARIAPAEDGVTACDQEHLQYVPARCWPGDASGFP